MHEKGLAQCLPRRKCTKTLAIRITSIISWQEKVRAKCNKISEALERGLATTSPVQKRFFFLRVSVKIMHCGQHTTTSIFLLESTYRDLVF